MKLDKRVLSFSDLEKRYCKLVYRDYLRSLARLDYYEMINKAAIVLRRQDDYVQQQIIDETINVLDLQAELNMLKKGYIFGV